jgi:hypothetical protein
MATPVTTKSPPKTGGAAKSKPRPAAASAAGRSANGSSNGHAKAASSGRTRPTKAAGKNRRRMPDMPEVPVWVGVVASVVGAGLVAGYYASQKGWFDRFRSWSDEHSAAFFDGETDADNFDQTRSAGKNAVRDAPEDWDDVDDIGDASFPASDPPSFNPGTA